jgi:hypothetical protein
MTKDQETLVRETAIRIYAAGNGDDIIPGEDAARAIFANATIEECIQQLPDELPDELAFLDE